MKQGLVEQGMYREQENSCLRWPDHTGVLAKRTGVSFEPLNDSHCDLGHFGSILSFSYLEGVQS